MEVVAAGGAMLAAAFPFGVGRMFLALSGALVAATLYKVLMATFENRGLMSSDGGSTAEPERIAMIMASIAAAAVYAYQALQARALPVAMLPPPPDWSLWLCGGGQLSYLVGKALRSQQENTR